MTRSNRQSGGRRRWTRRAGRVVTSSVAATIERWRFDDPARARSELRDGVWNRDCLEEPSVVPPASERIAADAGADPRPLHLRSEKNIASLGRVTSGNRG